MDGKKKGRDISHSSTYEKFLREIEPVTLGLISSRSGIDRTQYFQIIEDEKKAFLEITAAYKIGKVAKDYFDASGKFRLAIRKEGAKKAVLNIECEFEGHFHASIVKREFAKRFADSELRLVLWPYFRQFVSDITARMSIPPLVVPLSTKS